MLVLSRRSARRPFAWRHRVHRNVEHVFTRFNYRKVNLSQVFAGQRVGVRQVTDRIWLVSFMEYDLGPKVLPMSPE